MNQRFGVPERGLLAHRTVSALLSPAELLPGRRRDVDALLAWGRRPSALRVEQLGQRWKLPVLHLEDGLLRSLAKGRGHPPLALMVDDLGVHFDATQPCRLEQRVAEPIGSEQARRARLLQGLWCDLRLSKVNPAKESPTPRQPFVLVVDQSAGDCSIALGLAGPQSFKQMLLEALRDHPDCAVVVKVHPDVIHGRARGHFHRQDLQHPRIHLCADGLHPAALLEQARAVYVVTSQMGFEALLWGRPVHCFGMPFYAGWGLTRDRLPAPPRRRNGVGLEALVHAALVAGTRCVDPHQHRPCSIEELMRAIGLQRQMQGSMAMRVEAFGFTPWKQRSLRCFLAGCDVRFRWALSLPGRQAEAVAVWGRRARPRLLRQSQQRHLPVLRVEDGFLRSVGLGADLIDPISWVVDRTGMYYDATAPSDLERVLGQCQWSEAQLQRAAALRRRLVSEALTKYNLSGSLWQRPAAAGRVVLVVGQVESDASIRLGAPGLKSNMALLQAVRRAEPDAFLLYKPHPDVVAGLCRSGAGEQRADAFCDQVITEGSISSLFNHVDALHVLTSLAGFEALLRGVEVHCWGLPFYAGWGLTQDRHQCQRRGRALSLDGLVHGALIDYPLYVSRHSGWFITPEQAIDELVAWRQAPPARRSLVQALFRYWGRLRHR